MMTGSWPTHEVDHRDRNPSNNAWSNLREATPSQNTANRACGRGVRGVSWCKRAQKWRATIKHQNKQKYIGMFSDVDEAAAAYRRAASDIFGEFLP
jgi:hypothetical protein